MNCKVKAGPAIALPGVRGTGPQMVGLRMPMRLSSAAAVAAPAAASAATSFFGGLLMSLLSITVPPSIEKRRVGRRQVLLRLGHVELHAQPRPVPDLDIAVLDDRVGQALEDLVPP